MVEEAIKLKCRETDRKGGRGEGGYCAPCCRSLYEEIGPEETTARIRRPHRAVRFNRFDSGAKIYSFISINLSKMPRTLKPTPKSRHDPLHRDIAADDQYAKYGNVSKPGRRKKTRQHDEDGDGSAEVALLSRLVNRPALPYS